MEKFKELLDKLTADVQNEYIKIILTSNEVIVSCPKFLFLKKWYWKNYDEINFLLYKADYDYHYQYKIKLYWRNNVMRFIFIKI